MPATRVGPVDCPSVHPVADATMNTPAPVGFDNAAYEDFALEAGFEYPRVGVTVSKQEQHRLHGWCEIPAQVFGGSADPALVSRLPIVLLAHTVIAQRPRWVPVHTLQRITQVRAVALDETLDLAGHITRFEPHARGEIMHSLWRYFDGEGACVFEVRPQALLIDPARSGTPAGQAVASDARQWRLLGTKQCTPEATLGYCEGTRNPIHLDPEVAHSFGFRAPIIAGTQTMSYLLEPLYREHTPRSFDLSIGFLRPVFWDDELGIEGETASGSLRHVRAVNAAGKTVADCSIASSA